MAVTTPLGFTLATPVLLLVQLTSASTMALPS
jgi:hypothetical protein